MIDSELFELWSMCGGPFANHMRISCVRRRRAVVNVSTATRVSSGRQRLPYVRLFVFNPQQKILSERFPNYSRQILKINLINIYLPLLTNRDARASSEASDAEK